MNLIRLHSVVAIIAAALLGVPAFAEPPAKVALTGGRIISVVGEEIASGTVLIEHGRITAVGTDVEIPFDAMEVDCTGKVLLPGMIDPHSSRGLDITNENLAVAAFLDVYDAIDPSRLYFEEALREGVTSIHVMYGNNTVIAGVGRVVHPIGLSPDEMTQRTDTALKLSTTPRRGYDRMRQMAELRETFLDLDHYLERLAERKYEESLEEEEEEIAVGPAEARNLGRELIQDEDYDDQHANLVRLRRGDLDAWIYCGNATDVGPAIELANDQGMLDTTVLVLGAEAHKAVREIRRAGRPVVLAPQLTYRERDPFTNELSETFIPGLFHDAGVPFALQPNAGGSLAERYLNYQAAVCVRNGIPRQAALEAITIAPARMIGMEDRVGSIETGKQANIVIFSGDPLDFNSWVEQVYISGILAYDRGKDHRLQELLELEAGEDNGAADDGATDENGGGE